MTNLNCAFQSIGMICQEMDKRSEIKSMFCKPPLTPPYQGGEWFYCFFIQEMKNGRFPPLNKDNSSIIPYLCMGNSTTLSSLWKGNTSTIPLMMKMHPFKR